MHIDTLHNGLNSYKHNDIISKPTKTYTNHGTTLTQKKDLQNYKLTSHKESKAKKLISIILNIIKYFFMIVFFPITIIVIASKKLNEQLANRLHIDHQAVENSINANSIEYAYNQMFNDEAFSQFTEIQNNNMTAIEKRDFLSELFIKDIKDELGELTKEETDIIQAMQSLPNLKFQHQSNHKLINKNKLKIYSRERIRIAGTNKKIYFNMLFSSRDDKIGINDFVYFSVDFSGTNINEPPTIRTHGTDFYGKNSYVLSENKIGDKGYFTLVDQSTGHIAERSKTWYALENNGMKELMYILCEVIPRAVLKSSKYEVTPIFSPKDIKLGMALYIIKSIRKVDQIIEKKDTAQKSILISQRNKLIQLLLKNDENQNQLLNAILNLEYHYPVAVIADSKEYAEHKVSKPMYE